MAIKPLATLKTDIAAVIKNSPATKVRGNVIKDAMHDIVDSVDAVASTALTSAVSTLETSIEEVSTSASSRMATYDNLSQDIDDNLEEFYVRGRGTKGDEGHGIFRRVGDGYTTGDNDDAATRFGADYVVNETLYRRITETLTPEMFGAQRRTESDTDQSEPLQRMLDAAGQTGFVHYPVHFEVPYTEYRIENTLRLIKPRFDFIMKGKVVVPQASRITAMQVVLAGALDNVATSYVPLVRLRASKLFTTTAQWGDAAYTYAATWTATDDSAGANAERLLYIGEADCGIECIGAYNGSELYVDASEYFAIGFRAISTDDAIIPGSVLVGHSRFHIAGTRTNKVGVLVCTRNEAGASRYNNGNYYNYYSNVGVSNEEPAAKSRYGIVVTAYKAGGGTLVTPDGNVFDGGMTESWSRNNSSGSTDPTCVIADRSRFNEFKEYRCETYGNRMFPYKFPNTTASECRGNKLTYFAPDLDAQTPVHNGKDNEVISVAGRDGSATAGVKAVKPVREISVLSTENLQWSGNTKIKLPAPWVTSEHANQTYRDHIRANGGAWEDWNLSLATKPVIQGGGHQQFMGVVCKVRNRRPWNKITRTCDANVDFRLRASDVSGDMIDPTTNVASHWARLHNDADFTRGEYYGAFWLALSNNSADSFTITSSAVDTLLIGASVTSGQTLGYMSIKCEGVDLEPIDVITGNRRMILEEYPTAGYWPLGRVFIVQGKGEYRVTTAGYAGSPWNVDTSYTLNQYVTNAGKVYKNTTAGAGGSAPVHTSGTTGNWLFVATGTAFVAKQMEARAVVSRSHYLGSSMSEAIVDLLPKGATLLSVAVKCGDVPNSGTLSIMLTRDVANEAPTADDLLTGTINFTNADSDGDVKTGNIAISALNQHDQIRVKPSGSPAAQNEVLVMWEYMYHQETS